MRRHRPLAVLCQGCDAPQTRPCYDPTADGQIIILCPRCNARRWAEFTTASAIMEARVIIGAPISIIRSKGGAE